MTSLAIQVFTDSLRINTSTFQRTGTLLTSLALLILYTCIACAAFQHLSVSVGCTGVGVSLGCTGVSVSVGCTGVGVSLGCTGVSVSLGCTGVGVSVGCTGVSVWSAVM